mmetsp:Transcript_54016/g.175593  ORF Transcript_54016/g.175593 Transcript_54016/m.175593 type:complete len:127 (+) Transcript_54016:102-482(+)
MPLLLRFTFLHKRLLQPLFNLNTSSPFSQLCHVCTIQGHSSLLFLDFAPQALKLDALLSTVLSFRSQFSLALGMFAFFRLQILPQFMLCLVSRSESDRKFPCDAHQLIKWVPFRPRCTNNRWFLWF